MLKMVNYYLIVGLVMIRFMRGFLVVQLFGGGLFFYGYVYFVE